MISATLVTAPRMRQGWLACMNASGPPQPSGGPARCPPGALGIGAPGLGLGHLLDSQVVAPQGAEVVVVDETLTHPQPEVAQAHPVGVVAEDRAAVVAQAVLAAVHLEAVQVVTGPAEGHLKNVVEAGDAGVAWPQAGAARSAG